MRFRTAVEDSGIIAWYAVGLGALQRSDRGRVRCSNPRLITGSVNMEAALRTVFKDRRLWDYAIGVAANSRADSVVFVEVHPAASTNVSEILEKLRTLMDWLQTQGAPFGTLGGIRFVWIASGGVSIPRGSRHARRLAAAGLDYPRPVLQLN